MTIDIVTRYYIKSKHRKKTMFKAKSGAFTFPIGKLTVSVGFTPSHYCSNQAYPGNIVHAPTQLVTSKNVEVAVLTKKGKIITNLFFDCGHDQVAGWVTPKEFAKGLQKVITFTQIRKKPKTKPVTIWQVREGIDWNRQYCTQQEASDAAKNMIESWKALYPTAQIDIKESEGLVSQATIQVKDLHDVTLFVEQVQQPKKTKE